MVVQPQAKHLVVGTHGRSLYIADIANLQQLTPSLLAKQAHIFKIDDVRKSSFWGRSRANWATAYTPEMNIPFYVNADKKVTLDVYSGDVKVNSFSVAADKGMNDFSFDISFSKSGLKAYEKANKDAKIEAAGNGVYYLPKGKYTVKIEEATSEFIIK